MLKLLRFFILFFLLTTALSAKENHLDTVKLQLKWFTSFQFAGYYMALEKGYYKDVGIDVEIIERDPSINNIQQVIDSQAEYGIADSTILLYRAKNEPVKILASIFQHNPLILIAKKSSNIVSPYEMKGKIISYDKELDDSPIMAMFKHTNIQESDYTYKLLDYSAQDFIEGKVDVMSAYISNQPFLFRELGIEVNIINPLSYGVDFYGDNLFTTQHEIDNHPLRVKNFTEASLKGWKYALEHKEETIQIIKTKYKTNMSYEHLMFEAQKTQELMLTNLIDIGYTSIDRFKRIADIYKEIGMISENEADDALEELIYNPTKIQNKDDSYLYIFFALASLYIVVIIIFSLFNRHLKITVKKRTKELLLQQATVDKYVIMAETDKQGVISYASSAFCQVSGYEESELLNKKNSIIKHPDTPLSTYKSLWGTITKGNSWKGEIKNRKKDGSFYWLSLDIDNIYDSDGVKIGYRSIMQDISNRKLAEELAVTDTLTRIYNRLHLDRIVEKELLRSDRHGSKLSVILIDVDNFKNVNDVYGHQVGDIVLQEISKILKSNIRKTDTVGRWGGEEFLIILPNTEINSAKVLAEKIRLATELHLFSEIKNVTVSLGVSSWYPQDTKDSLIKKADDALYKAKESGRNIVKVED